MTQLVNYIYEFVILGHPANSPFFRYLTNLPPFALWMAFPSALVGRNAHDYYGGSVTVCLSTLRQSRDTVHDERYQAILGGPFIPFVSLLERCSCWKFIRRNRTPFPSVSRLWVSAGFPIGPWFDRWGLDLKQCSFHHDSQSLRSRLEGIYLRPTGASAPLNPLYLDAMFMLWFPVALTKFD